MVSKSYKFNYSTCSTVELQYNGLASSAAKRLVYWSLPLFSDHFYINNKKRSAANRTVYWIWPLFWEDGKLEFHCIRHVSIIGHHYYRNPINVYFMFGKAALGNGRNIDLPSYKLSTLHYT